MPTPFPATPSIAAVGLRPAPDLARLQKQVAEGSYRVDARRIAARMLAESRSFAKLRRARPK
jgi:hypothetical protein